MYPNLDAEMARKKFNTDDIAQVIGKDPRTVRSKLSGKTNWLYIETKTIKDKLFPKLDIEYLFKTEEKNRKE